MNSTFVWANDRPTIYVSTAAKGVTTAAAQNNIILVKITLDIIILVEVIRPNVLRLGLEVSINIWLCYEYQFLFFWFGW